MRALTKERWGSILSYHALICKIRINNSPANQDRLWPIYRTDLRTCSGSGLLSSPRTTTTTFSNKSCLAQQRMIRSDISLEATLKSVTLLIEGLKAPSKGKNTGMETKLVHCTLQENGGWLTNNNRNSTQASSTQGPWEDLPLSPPTKRWLNEDGTAGPYCPFHLQGRKDEHSESHEERFSSANEILEDVSGSAPSQRGEERCRQQSKVCWSSSSICSTCLKWEPAVIYIIPWNPLAKARARKAVDGRYAQEW